MKTIAEITALRKQGCIDEALREAKCLYEEDPSSYSAVVCFAWVLIDLMKVNANHVNIELFCKSINEFKALNLSLYREDLLHNNVLWAILRLLTNYANTPDADKRGLDILTATVQELPVYTNSEAYRGVLSTASKIKDWQGYRVFVAWWNLDNLRSDDFRKTMYAGKELMSLAERTYNALCRCFMVCDDEDEILGFVKKLSPVILAHPEFQYLPYYQAKLLFKIGKAELAIEALKPFVRKKASDFWVWQLLGDEVSDNSQKMMFYCKAALCVGKDEMLVKMREQIGFFLIRNGKREMGKYLIEKVIDTRIKENRRPSFDIQSITKEAWWSSTPAQWDFQYANEQALGADEFLFGKMNQYEVLVTFVNAQKGAISFVTEDKRNGFFLDHSKLLKTIQSNDVLQITAPEISVSGVTKVSRWTKVTDRTNPHFYHSYSGIFRKNASGFGFVDRVFVHAALANGITDRASVVGTAVMAFDKKKQCFGWKAITIFPDTDGIQ